MHQYPTAVKLLQTLTGEAVSHCSPKLATALGRQLRQAAETWAFNPATGNLYNGHQLNEHGQEGKKHLMADPKADLVGRQEGAVVTAIVSFTATPAFLHPSSKFGM